MFTGGVTAGTRNRNIARDRTFGGNRILGGNRTLGGNRMFGGNRVSRTYSESPKSIRY